MLILQKTKETPESVELYDLKLIWKSLQEDIDNKARLAFARLMRQLHVKMSLGRMV